MRALLFAACLLPFLKLVWAGFHAGLGVNPVEFVEHATGDWALRFLCVTLAVTPLVRLSGWTWWMKRRRMLGLFVSFYAALHFLTYWILDAEMSFGALWRDASKRPYISAGAGCLLLLAPLTATSNDRAIRALKRWWSRVHFLVYPAAVLAVIHYLWLVKKDKTVPLRYAAVVAVLLGYRATLAIRKALTASKVVSSGA